MTDAITADPNAGAPATDTNASEAPIGGVADLTTPAADPNAGAPVSEPTAAAADSANQGGDLSAAGDDKTESGVTPSEYFADSLPQDWRAQIAAKVAGEDGDATKVTKQLERFSSMDAVVKALMDSQETIRSGQIKAETRPDEAAGPEALSAWRESRGVPETADGYELKAPEGVILGDADKAVFENMREFFHGNDVPAEQVDGMVAAWHESNEAARAAVNQRQQQQLTDSISALRSQWGTDYDANISVLDSFLDQMPQETRELFEYATLSDGSPLTANPAIVSFMVAKEREANPVATSVPMGSGTIQSVDAEIKQLEARMGTNEWFKDDAAQARYRELVTAQTAYNKKHG